jgi:hypothetical protein
MASMNLVVNAPAARNTLSRWFGISPLSFGTSSGAAQQVIESSPVRRFSVWTMRQRSCHVGSLCLLAITILSGCSPTGARTLSATNVTGSTYASPEHTSTLPASCAYAYGALLDVATLARSYGRGSSVFVDAIDQLTRQLDDCISQATRKESWYPVRAQASSGVDDPRSQSGGRMNRPLRT